MIASGKVNKVLQEAVKNYSKTYTEAGIKIKTDVVTLASELKEIVDKNKKRDEYIENTKKAIDDLSDKLFASNDAESSLEAKAESLLLELDEKASKLIEYYKETFVGTADNPPIKKVMADLKDAANSDKESIDKLLGEVENEIEDLHEFYEKVYGKPTTDGGVVGGLENYLSQKKRDLDDFEGKQKIKYKTLNDQIENLLPGATSAGLASAYYDLKKSFDDPIKSATYLFYGALLALVVIAFISTVDNVGRYYINFVDLNNWDVLLRLAYKMPLYLPVLWLGLYASRRRSESQRLQQEYAHKEALAKSYDSYKKQIEALDDKDLVMQKVFIMKAVDAIAYNASNTLDKSHGDKMPAQEILEKILDKTEELIKIKKVLTE